MMAPPARVAGLLAATRTTGASDAELLGRFVAEGDGAAFTALVARHGPMVLGVCRRVVRDGHLAEDAFQATFMVLARKAATVSPPGAVAGWLHAVAYRVAKGARRTALRRTGRERPIGDAFEPATPPAPDTDLRDVIDGEVQQLPRKYRDLIVACDLEERARRPVAAALGIPEGTLSSRLTAARKILAERLARRGVAAAGAALVALGGPRLVACEVPRRVLASAARLGCSAPGTVPAAIASLASKASRTVTHRILAPVALLALAACGALSATLTAANTPSGPPVPTAAPPSSAVRRAEPPRENPKPAPKGPNKLLITRVFRGPECDRHLVLVDPDGKNEESLPSGDGKYQPHDAWLSPDGSMLAVLGTDTLYVRKPDDKDAVTDLGVKCRHVNWSADGTRLACADYLDRTTGDGVAFSNFLIDVKTKEKTVLKLPTSHMITDWSRDGKYFLTTSWEFTKDSAAERLHLMNRDGTEHKTLTDKTHLSALGRFSPDEKRVLFVRMPSPKKDQKRNDNLESVP